MNQYKEMDHRILKAIEQRSNPLCSQQCRDEAKRLAEATGRESFRVIDGRLQAMRKAGEDSVPHEGGKRRARRLAFGDTQLLNSAAEVAEDCK